MTWKLQAAIVGLLAVLATGATWMLNSSMPSSDLVDQARQAANLVHNQLLALDKEPRLPSLASSWMRFEDAMSSCVVAISPLPQKDKDDNGTPHWDAAVEGGTGSVFTCLTMAAQTLPMNIFEIHIQGDRSMVAVRLFGTQPDMPKPRPKGGGAAPG